MGHDGEPRTLRGSYVKSRHAAIPRLCKAIDAPCSLLQQRFELYRCKQPSCAVPALYSLHLCVDTAQGVPVLAVLQSMSTYLDLLLP